MRKNKLTREEKIWIKVYKKWLMPDYTKRAVEMANRAVEEFTKRFNNK
jgi:hypothetical protein